MKVRFLIPMLIFLTADVTATVLIDSIKGMPSSSVSKYSKFEISIASFWLRPENQFNPYDSSSVDMYAIFTSPSGKQYRRNAFWMMQYRRYDSSYYQKSRFLTVAIPVS